ncbi:heptahelical transmembrane protein ADIPOR2-like [Hordeum vulgare]|nr:heptahelical transmembrane protein ADIPOR2-like [Hordeum vulgare]
MKAMVYALSSFQQQVMPGLWKDITTKIHHKFTVVLLLSHFIALVTVGAANQQQIMEIQSALASGMCGAGHAVARWPRTVFMFRAMTCLFVSAAAHLLASHSRRFNRLFWQLNYAGYGELFSRYIDDLDF